MEVIKITEEVHMNCYRCGDTMILKKIHDYGGYSWDWKCTRCGAIIDQMLRRNHWMKEDTQQKGEIKEANRAR